MYLTRLLSLSSTGTVLVVSQIPWFFNSFPKAQIMDSLPLEHADILGSREEEPSLPEPQKLELSNEIPESKKTPLEQPKSSQSSEQKRSEPKAAPSKTKKQKEPEINKQQADGFVSRTREIFPATFTNRRVNNKMNLITNASGEEKYMYPLLQSFTRDFTFRFKGYKSDYEKIKKEDININLFTTSAWNSPTKEDEYGNRVDQKDVLSLFNLGMDELKVKQLLLNLSSRRHWKKYHDYLGKEGFYAEDQGWLRPRKVDELKDLKINHFKDFAALKDYIRMKVDKCTSPDKACIADEKELDAREYDELNYHREAW